MKTSRLYIDGSEVATGAGATLNATPAPGPAPPVALTSHRFALTL